MAHKYRLEERIRKIEGRNAKVESDKAWELSWTRKILLALFTSFGNDKKTIVPETSQ